MQATAMPSWTRLAAVFLFAVMVRGAAVAAQYPSLASDPDAYRHLAINLRETGTFGYQNESPTGSRVRPTAYRPPLYPMILALFVRNGALASSSVAALHVAIGAATVTLVFLVAWRGGLGRWSYLGATLTACDPILLNQSAAVMTETLATLLAVVGVAALAGFDRHPSLGRAGLAGAVLGIATLCRPTYLFWLAFVACAWTVLPRRTPRWRDVLVLVAAAGAALAPWTVRNVVQFQRPIFATTHGGYTFWLANNDQYYDHLARRREPVFDAELLLPQLRQLRGDRPRDETWEDRQLYREAFETIRRRPADFAHSIVTRTGDLWRLTPRPLNASESTRRTLARRLVGVWYGGVFVFAAVGALSLGRRWLEPPWLASALLCLAFTFAHAFYWTDMRMRAPLMPVVCVVAAAGAHWLARRRRGGRYKPWKSEKTGA